MAIIAFILGVAQILKVPAWLRHSVLEQLNDKLELVWDLAEGAEVFLFDDLVFFGVVHFQSHVDEVVAEIVYGFSVPDLFSGGDVVVLDDVWRLVKGKLVVEGRLVLILNFCDAAHVFGIVLNDDGRSFFVAV